MSTITSFDNPWYHEYINRVQDEFGDASESAKAIGHAIIAAGCVIAQAIDGMASKVMDNDLLGHEICMGIRHGLFGAGANSHDSILHKENP